MRVLMISDVYFPRVNGVSTSIRVFRRELTALGHEVTLIAPDYPGAPPEPGIVRVPSRYLFIDPEDRLMRGRALRALASELRAGGYDLIHIQTPFIAHRFGVRMARDLGLPCVETYHTYFEEYARWYLPWLPRRLTELTARSFTRSQCNELDAVIAPSGAMREVLLGYGVTRPVEVLPTGIEMDEFALGDRARFRAAHGIAVDQPVLLYVGRVAREKNIELLLEVARLVRREIPDLLLVVAGEGPARNELAQRSRELNLADNVLFIGYLDRREALPDCYHAADLFVFGSRTETQGLVLLEAMAAGLPVVSTAVMGTRDLLRDGEGAVVVPEEPARFAQAIVHLLDNPVERQRLAVHARACAAHWSAAAMARRLGDFYGRVIGGEAGLVTARV